MPAPLKLTEDHVTLLKLLQNNARQGNRELGQHFQPVWNESKIRNHLKALESAEVIQGYGVRLNPARVRLDLTAFVHVRLAHSGDEKEFEQIMRDNPYVLECYTITGEADYMVKVIAENRAALSQFLLDILRPIRAVAHTETTIVMRTVKQDTLLPIQHLQGEPVRKRRSRRKQEPPPPETREITC